MRTLASFSVATVLFFGCGESVPLTPAQYFNQTQSNTNTPYGNVTDGSAVDNDDGSITFRTDDGVELTTTVIQTEAGPKYGTPTRSKKLHNPNRDISE